MLMRDILAYIHAWMLVDRCQLILFATALGTRCMHFPLNSVKVLSYCIVRAFAVDLFLYERQSLPKSANAIAGITRCSCNAQCNLLLFGAEVSSRLD